MASEEAGAAGSAAADCIFCKILAGSIPASVVYEDEECLAFRDISPAAPVHLLIIPRRHVENVAHCGPQQQALLGHLHLVAARLAREHGVEESGYRLVLNNGAGAGQSVWHLHLHLLGGRPLAWPPG